MFFVEGYKILYRFGLAIIKVNKSRLKEGGFEYVSIFEYFVDLRVHSSLLSDGRNGDDFWDTQKKHAGYPHFDFESIFNFAFDKRPNNFFKISIVPGRSKLQKFEADTRTVMTEEQLAAPLEQELVTSVDTVKTFTNKGSISLLAKSNILDQGMASVLYSYLLPAAQMEPFELMFSTYNDGWNLETLYEKVREFQ